MMMIIMAKVVVVYLSDTFMVCLVYQLILNGHWYRQGCRWYTQLYSGIPTVMYKRLKLQRYTRAIGTLYQTPPANL